jgi:hypothetical protein
VLWIIGHEPDRQRREQFILAAVFLEHPELLSSTCRSGMTRMPPSAS